MIESGARLFADMNAPGRAGCLGNIARHVTLVGTLAGEAKGSPVPGGDERKLVFAGYVAVAILSAVLLVVSGLGKLRRNPYIVRSVHEVARVPMHWFPILAGLEVAAAAGLLAGIKIAPVGIAATTGMVLYFVGAIVAHLRAKDAKGLGPAIQMLCLAIAALTTRTFSM